MVYTELKLAHSFCNGHICKSFFTDVFAMWQEYVFSINFLQGPCDHFHSWDRLLKNNMAPRSLLVRISFLWPKLMKLTCLFNFMFENVNIIPFIC